MIENHLYNLMMQLVSESKSLKRIQESYEADAGGCQDCINFWQKMKEDKESHVKELSELIKGHLS